MKLLVTGGSGFIGSSLIRRAIEKGHEVLNLDKLTYAANPLSLQDLEGDPGYRFVHADICDEAAVHDAFTAFRPDAVIHLAAETHVDRSIDKPDAFIDTNITGTFTLLKAAREYLSASQLPPAAFRFLHLSTDEVFGSLGPDDSPFAESSPYAPRSPYAASKAGSDHIVRAWSATYGLPATVVHACNIYGPRQFPEKLIPLVILKALRGEPIPIYGDGKQIRDWLHVDDLTEGILSVLTQGEAGQSYNLAAGNPLANLDIVQKVLSIRDDLPKTPITFVSDRPGHDYCYALDTTKAREALGWQAAHPVDRGLHETVDWYLGNEAWWRPILDATYSLERLGLRG